MELKFILDALGEYGPWLGGLMIILFFIFKLSRTDWGKAQISSIMEKMIEKYLKKTTDVTGANISESDVSNHDIFNYIDFWRYSKVPTFQFSTDYRTVVFRKYLFIYLSCYKSNLLKFVNSKDYKSMDSAQIRKSFLNLMNTIVYDYEKEMSDVGIPKIIIDKMKVKNNDTITLTIDLIEGVCGSQFYESENNLLKVYSILNILLSVLENTIMQSEPVCNSINGQLRGLTFDGKTEP